MAHLSMGYVLFALAIKKTGIKDFFSRQKEHIYRQEVINKFLGRIEEKYKEKDKNGKVKTYSGLKNKEVWDNIDAFFSKRKTSYTNLLSAYVLEDVSATFEDWEICYKEGKIPPLSAEEGLLLLQLFDKDLTMKDIITDKDLTSEHSVAAFSQNMDLHYACYYFSNRKRVEILYLGLNLNEKIAYLHIYEELEDWFGTVTSENLTYFISLHTDNVAVGWQHFVLKKGNARDNKILQGLGVALSSDGDNPLGFEILCEKVGTKSEVDKMYENKEMVAKDKAFHLLNKRMEVPCDVKKWSEGSTYKKMVRSLEKLVGNYEMYNLEKQDGGVLSIHKMKCTIATDFSVCAFSPVKNTHYTGTIKPMMGNSNAFIVTFTNEQLVNSVNTDNLQPYNFFTSILVISELGIDNQVVLEGTYTGFTRRHHPHCGRDLWIKTTILYDEIDLRDYLILDEVSYQNQIKELSKKYPYLLPFFAGQLGKDSDGYMDSLGMALPQVHHLTDYSTEINDLIGLWYVYSLDSENSLNESILKIESENKIYYKGKHTVYTDGEIKFYGNDLYLYLYGKRNAMLNTVLHYKQNISRICMSFNTIGADSLKPVVGTAVLQRISSDIAFTSLSAQNYLKGSKEYETLENAGIIPQLKLYIWDLMEE